MYNVFIKLGEIFLQLFNISITASWLVLAIIIAKLLLKKAPKWINCVLWGLVAIRLLVPFNIESPFSLIPSRETLPASALYSGTYQSMYPQVDSGFDVVDAVLQPAFTEAPGRPVQLSSISMIACVWIIGIVTMLIYSLISYTKVRKSVREAMHVQENIFLCDSISTPFILGLIKPKIYLPSSLYKDDVLYVIDHEKAHIKRLDHLWKPLGYLLLTAYWFNPAMWVAYILLCKDIELACDERVVKELDADCKKEYSNALINCSSQRRLISACPLAFGETTVKDRIKSVLSYKKPAFWVIMVALVLCVAISVGFLTVPSSDSAKDILDERGYSIVAQEDEFIPVNVPVSVFTNEIYSENGQKFQENQVIVFDRPYNSNSYCQTNIYLTNAIATETKIDLHFKFSYDELQESGIIYSGYKHTEQGYPYTVDVKDENSIRIDEEHYYENGAVMGFLLGPNDSQGSSEFAISVSIDAFKKAEETLGFDIYCTKTGYKKESLFKSVDSEMCEFIEKTILEKEWKASSKDAFGCVSFIPVKTERIDGNTKVYIISQLGEFTLNKGTIFFSGEKSPHLATITLKEEKEGYSLIDYWALDGYKSSFDQIKEHFPEILWKDVELANSYYYDVLCMENHAKANAYFAGETKDYTGTYIFYGSREAVKPTLILKPNNNFVFNYSHLSSQFLTGHYEISAGHHLLLNASNNKAYLFTITDEGFVFDSYNSADIPEYKVSGDSEESYCPVPDGAVFIADQTVGVNSYFDATILEIYDGSILVEPFPDEPVCKSANKLSVSTKFSSSLVLPKLYVGDEIRVCYDGMIQETFPAQINGTIAIYQLESLTAEALKDTLIADDIAMIETISLPSADSIYADSSSNIVDKEIINSFASVFNEIYLKSGIYEAAEADEDYQGSVFIINVMSGNGRFTEIKILGKEFIRFGKNDLRQITEYDAERLINMFTREKYIHEKVVETSVGKVDMPEWTFRETAEKVTKSSNADDLYKLFGVEPCHIYEDGADYYACYNDNYVLVIKYGEYARRYQRGSGSGVAYTPID